MQVYIDGKYYPQEEAKISVWDHGYLYGDGIFEGIRAYNGRIFRLDQHIDRLYDSAKSILLKIPLAKAEMIEAVLETCRKNNISDGYVRLVISRGIGDLGLDPRKCLKSTIVIIADKINLYSEEKYQNGLKVIIAATRKNFPEALNPRIKSLNYLNNILAKIEGIQAGAEEVVLINTNGFVTECSAENIFIYKKGILSTPRGSVGILEGITRDTVLEIAQNLGIKVEESLLTSHDLFVAEEFFLTGTAAEIIPVVEINGRIIGEGKPGKLTLRLLEEFRKITKIEGSPIYQKEALKEKKHLIA
ncbi:MAG: branched-chain-amino-acid transaminase [Armatimonadetes bacterium]|nr:branched-chain-amino-acid transaminase [Armatimonadota bacterium]